MRKRSSRCFIKVSETARHVLVEVRETEHLFKGRNASLLMRPHKHFIIFFIILLLLSIFANSTDWWIDLGFYSIVYAILWAICAKWEISDTALTLLILLPLPHLLGGFGFYHWSYGNMSYDIIVHVVTSFIAVLLLANISSKLKRPSHAVAIIIAIILVGAVTVEVVEWAAGQAGEGEGMFLRGAGDYCAQPPCPQLTDTYKDMISNALGTALGLLAVFARPTAQRSAG
jgi:uncharacterized membrane protein YjdF